MKTITKLRNRKAVSPVIATVILVAVAITVSVGVSYWMSGISAQYTEFEKIEIQTGYSTSLSPGWVVELALKNTGSATSSVTHVFVNDKPVALTHVDGGAEVTGVAAAGSIVTNLPVAGLTINAGESKTVKIWINPLGTTTDPAYYLSSGTTVNIKLHSAGGMDYIKLIKLT